MIKVTLDNDILYSILNIERTKEKLNNVEIPLVLSNKFRKNTMKMSSYASNKIEGNPLTFNEAINAIESTKRHLLKPEQEIRNYYLALELLNKKLDNMIPISLDLILEVQKIICDGLSEEKIGIRGEMPPGFLFAVWNSEKTPSYIPPEASEVKSLLDEMIDYINNSDDHPLIKAALIHYLIVTIHPFEDGNGRTARIISNYYLALYGYSFKNVGSLEEYISYDIEDYYNSLQMGLPVLYYDGRNNPPHIEIWIKYYLKIINLYSSKVLSIALDETRKIDSERIKALSNKAKAFLKYLTKHSITSFAPIDLSKAFKVTNRTIINWCTELTLNGYLKPIIVNKRIRKYEVIN